MRSIMFPNLADLFFSVPIGLVIVDDTGRVLLANLRAEVLFHTPENGLPGTPFKNLFPRNPQAFLTTLRTAKPDEVIDWTARRTNGDEFPVEISVSRLESEHGVGVGNDGGTRLMLAIRDLTVPKREEQLLRGQVRQQALVAELGRQALTGIDLGQFLSDAVRRLASHLEVESARLIELLPDGRGVVRGWVGDHDPAHVPDDGTDELKPGTPAGQVILDQLPVLIEDARTDGRFPTSPDSLTTNSVSSLTVPLYGQSSPLGVLSVHANRVRHFSDGEIHFVQAVANVAATAIERHRHEERLRERHLFRAEQMAALGQVAAGVAHELRNPLTSIKGLVQVNLREATAHGLPADDLQIIEQEIRRMERTLQTFLDFARPPRPDRRRLECADIVSRVYALVGGRARKQGVALRFTPPTDPIRIDGDQDQLQQLLLNLVLNALDAMPTGGTLEVELRAERNAPIEWLVRDTGPGIAPDILPKVFETFVSSKETGIGIGLPVSRRIAEDHGGTLSAYNLPNGGACFTLRLPAVS